MYSIFNDSKTLHNGFEDPVNRYEIRNRQKVYAVLYETPVGTKYSDSGSRFQGISVQVIWVVLSAC